MIGDIEKEKELDENSDVYKGEFAIGFPYNL